MGLFDFLRTSPNTSDTPRDERKAECPNCHVALKKVPGSKTKCPNCGQFMYIRTRPKDNVRVVVSKEEADKIDEEWTIVSGTHDAFLENKQRFAEEKAALGKRFGKEASDQDVMWSLLNKETLEHMKNGDWGLYRNAKFQMGEVLRKEMRFAQALDFYCEVCYLDLNGANNVGGMDPELRKEFPAFDPSSAFLAPGIVDLMRRLVKKLDLTLEDLKDRFIEYNKKISKGLNLPLSPEECWPSIQKELEQNPI